MKKNIIFIAPPAAGKGSQSSMLKSEFNLAHISTGDLLREEAKKDSKLKSQMESGNLIDDATVTKLLEKRLKMNDCDNGYILDGYPRNINQANILEELLNKLNKQVNYVFYLDIDKELALKRACGRLGCPKCGRIYNKFFEESKPKVDNLCDECNVTLVHRDDDNEKSFEHRFDTFMEKTKPLIDYYKEKNLLYNIDSNFRKELVHEKIVSILNQKG